MLRSTIAFAVLFGAASAAQIYAHVEHVEASLADLKQEKQIPMFDANLQWCMNMLAWILFAGAIVAVALMSSLSWSRYGHYVSQEVDKCGDVVQFTTYMEPASRDSPQEPQVVAEAPAMAEV